MPELALWTSYLTHSPEHLHARCIAAFRTELLRTCLEGEEREAVDHFTEHELARQRRLRDRLGIGAEQERQLRCNYFWLQLWDRISLDICRYGFSGFSEDYPATPTGPDAGAETVRLHIELRPGGTCRLHPYPLLPSPYRARIPAVLVPAALAGDRDRLHAAWRAGGGDGIDVTFQAGL